MLNCIIAALAITLLVLALAGGTSPTQRGAAWTPNHGSPRGSSGSILAISSPIAAYIIFWLSTRASQPSSSPVRPAHGKSSSSAALTAV